MKKIFALSIVFFVVISSFAFAQENKVVVVPLSSNKTAPPGFFMAFGYVGPSGNLGESYGVLSASRTDFGDYTVTLEKSFSAGPIVTATAFSFGNSDVIVTWSSSNTGNTIFFYVANGTGTPLDSGFTFIVYGPTQ